jgi:hypothetical protein
MARRCTSGMQQEHFVGMYRENTHTHTHTHTLSDSFVRWFDIVFVFQMHGRVSRAARRARRARQR